MNKDSLRGLAVRAQEFHSLAFKVAEELRNPRQLFGAERRTELWNRGKEQISLISQTPEFELDAITRAMQESLISAGTVNRVEHYLSLRRSLHGSVFPADARIVFRPPFEPEPPKPIGTLVAEVSSTTNNNVLANSEAYPSEGYKTRSEVKIPFKPRAPQDEEQHGGFVIDNNSASLQVLDYDSFRKARKKDLGKRQYVVEANWYMDSKNYQSVAARPNLERRRIYNGLGTLFLPNGSIRYFTVNTSTEYAEVKDNVFKDGSGKEPVDVAMRHVAALCNSMALVQDAVAWRIGGLEFYEGGARQYTGPLSKNSFAIYGE